MELSAIPPSRAYSYVRFSTTAQALGASLQRQTEQAHRYALERGLELDTELNLTDPGVSAFRSSNARTGALSVFLGAVQSGRVPRGSYLLIENIDRLTRADLPEAMSLFLQIITSGITVVTLTNRLEYSNASLVADPTSIYMIVAEIIRANQESVRKSGLLLDAFERRRQALWNGSRSRPYTRQTPAWIGVDGEGNHRLLAERVEIIKEIFERASEGWSPGRIARALNERQVPVWGTGKRAPRYWHNSYVLKMLKNPAVIGTFTPRKTERDEVTRVRRDTPLRAVSGYFPAAIPLELFERVSARSKARHARGRNADGVPRSILAGIACCNECGGTVTRIDKGEYKYLVCSRAHAKAGCVYRAVSYANVEEAIRENAEALIEEAPRGDNTDAIDERIGLLELEAEGLRETIRTVTDELIVGRSEALRRRLSEAERAIKAVLRRLEDAREQRERIGAPYVLARLTELRNSLRAEPFDLPRANRAMAVAFSKAVIDPPASRLTLHWRDTEESSYLTIYTGKHSRLFDGASGDHDVPRI
jgi:DNA invertase Pin-like site-specific DNA recombinase